MSRVHPADQSNFQDNLLVKEIKVEGPPCTLTVWKRSSMSFQGTDGFTVFDHHGRLVFRVDNYSRKYPCGLAGGLVLMNGAGNALLTLKPQIMSMQYQWNAYRGDQEMRRRKCKKSKVFSMRTPSLLFQRQRKDQAEVFLPGLSKKGQVPDFRIQGSFRSRNCLIRTATGEVAAKITRKRVNSTVLLSDDVFSLVVQPGFDMELIMAFVVVLDRICANPFTPILCS
ncbi:hypothetical protein SLEP1_g16440 [Rubroshorea leprosula]|uniref:Protein LURP-one-related 5-like n=1 Tax=Rubroshorea leprosula TaxID=152421 RepID=A0AAV5IZQ2_9ROSI|nr:hypothetical protein SLEP1_g16440 [Rubroshorea leprosula]